MTHAPTMAAVAAFVWYWTATMDRRSLGPLDRPRRAGRLRRPGALAERAVRAAAGDRGAGRAVAGRPRPRRRVAPLDARRRRRLHHRRGRGVHAADARLEGDLRALPGGVADRAADPLAASAPRRRPVRVAERPVRDVADPLRRGDRAGDLRAPATGGRRAVPGRDRRDDLLQRVDSGLVGQRRLRRPALRRDAAVVRARRRRRRSSDWRTLLVRRPRLVAAGACSAAGGLERDVPRRRARQAR